jgi:hypothetical protein
MEMKETKKIYEKIRLENNLDLAIFAGFKHTAGDRCQIKFEAVIDVDINKDLFEYQALNNLDMNKVMTLLGDKTSYSYSKIRNFIAEEEKEEIFEELRQQFLENNLEYISSLSFPAKLIKRNYLLAEKEEMIRLQREAYIKNIQ